MADKETLLVVVGVDEPAGNALGAVAAHLPGTGVEDVHAIDLDPHLAMLGGQDLDVRLAEDDEEVARPSAQTRSPGQGSREVKLIRPSLLRIPRQDGQ